MRHLRLRDITGGVDHQLLDQGMVGRGVVTSVELERMVRAGSGEHLVCRLTIRVHLGGDQPYTASVHQRIPSELVPALTNGASTVPVRVDPADGRRVAIDVAAMYR